jgi:excisionase family DNA binding protein
LIADAVSKPPRTQITSGENLSGGAGQRPCVHVREIGIVHARVNVLNLYVAPSKPAVTCRKWAEIVGYIKFVESLLHTNFGPATCGNPRETRVFRHLTQHISLDPMITSLHAYQDRGTTAPHPTQKQAAEFIGIDVKTIRRWISQGRLTAYRVGPRLIRVDRESILKLASPIGGAA